MCFFLWVWHWHSVFHKKREILWTSVHFQERFCTTGLVLLISQISRSGAFTQIADNTAPKARVQIAAAARSVFVNWLTVSSMKRFECWVIAGSKQHVLGLPNNWHTYLNYLKWREWRCSLTCVSWNGSGVRHNWPQKDRTSLERTKGICVLKVDR
jgi:hypothetical protein